MQIHKKDSESVCARLHEYLEGEMPHDDECVFESHIPSCENCRVEIGLHHRMTAEIDKFPADQIILPKDFSRIVAAKAESQVGGLRIRNERKITVAIVAGLALLVFIFLGANFEVTSNLLFFIADRFLAFFLVIGNFVFNFLLGIFIILKVVATQLDLSPITLIGVFGIVLASLFLVYIFRPGRSSIMREAKR